MKYELFLCSELQWMYMGFCESFQWFVMQEKWYESTIHHVDEMCYIIIM